MAKQERIDFRVSESIKTCFADAAEASGMTLSTFMIAAAQEQAARVLRQQQAVVLSDRDRDRFLSALDRPVRSIPQSVRKAKKRQSSLVKDD